MTPHGLRHVEAAKADGRWAAAYKGSRTMTMPADLLRAIEADPKAAATFAKLDRQNLYSLAFRLGNLKTAAGREKKIAAFVQMLRRGEAIYPIKAGGSSPRARAPRIAKKQRLR
jgi:uncharacterized protein YdeI (YjbR/CyaY-like superfamily)